MQVTIIDYSAGNAVNVKNAFESLGIEALISKEETVWKNADAIVFPGVGSFGAAMENLGSRSETLKELIQDKKVPFLGICLGMQLLLDQSMESKDVQGWGLITGTVKRFKGSLPVPHMGWNKVMVSQCPLFAGMKDFYAYFVHSYYCDVQDKSLVSATTVYGNPFPSAFWKDNIFATQFHPEKSGENGLQLLKNFIKEVKQ